MKNITLSVEEDVLREVRKIAAESSTTVNALVRAHLADLVRQKKSIRRMRELAEQGGMEVGAKTWTRDDTHER